MIFQSLTIALKNPWAAASEANPYQAKLSISHNDNTMQVALSAETCHKILVLAGPDIAAAAQVQIDEFIRTAIEVSTTPAIEAKAVTPDRLPF